MGNPWYRAWVGLVSDEKIAEAAVVAEAPRCLVIAVWHALLESASEVDGGGVFATTPRRVAAILCEPAARVQGVFAALEELAMIRESRIVAWEKRQMTSESRADAAERQREHRERSATKKRATSPAQAHAPPQACHNLSQRVTLPESELELELEVDSAAAARGRERDDLDLSTAKPVGRDPLEAEARVLMGDCPVVVDVDFTPIAVLLDEPGIARADVLVGLTQARERANVRLKSWRQCVGWVRQAAKDRIGAAQGPRSGFARAPPGRNARTSDLSACLEIMRGDQPGAEREAEFARGGARAGPVFEGVAVAL